MRVSKLKVLCLTAAFVTSACGLRASKAQIEAARKGQPVQVEVAGGGGGVTAGAPGGDSTPGATTPAATGANPAATGSQTAAGGATNTAAGTGAKANAAGATTTTAAPGDNGGATDVGVTADSINMGNVSTMSGPVPGLFQGAVIGTQAAVAYINSLGGINGRKLKLDVRDDQFDTGQNRAQTIDLLGKAFGFLGSFSLYDDAAVNEIKSANIPDLTYSLSDARRAIPNNFSVQPGAKGWRMGPINYFKQKFPDAVKSVGVIYGAIPSAASSYQGFKAAAQSAGYNFVYERGTQPTETDFTADVVRMRQSGVKMVYITSEDVKSTARLAASMAQQNFKPDVFVSGGVAYDPAFLPLAGANAEGLIDEQQMAMYDGEDSGSVPEVSLFDQWVQKVKPGYKPDLFAVFGWAETRLFADAAAAAGPKLTRQSLIQAVQKITTFDDHGMLAPAGPGSKTSATCYVMLQVKDNKWIRYDSPPSGFRCNEGPYFKA